MRLFTRISRGVENEQPFYPEALYIMVLSAFRKQEGGGEREGEHLGGSDRPPDTVHTEEERQDQHGRSLENQCPHKGDRCRNRAVVEGGKKGRGENIKACQQEGEGKEPERVASQRKQLRIIAHKYAGERRGQQKGGGGSTMLVPAISSTLFLNIFFSSPSFPAP